MMQTSPAALLAAWERSAAAPAPDRAPMLLPALDPALKPDEVDELTVGQCDARLYALRRALFGDRLDAVVACPVCGLELELELELSALQPPLHERPPDRVSLTAGGYTVACRVPRNRDLRALPDESEAAALRALLARCALEGRAPHGAAAPMGELDDGCVDELVRALADLDPGVETAVAIVCPCAHRFSEPLEIRSIVWTDLTDWLGRTLTEVHELARAYGWSEPEILAMTPWRRRWYLEAIAG